MRIAPLTKASLKRIDGVEPPVTMKGLEVTDNSGESVIVSVARISGANFIAFSGSNKISKKALVLGWKAFKSGFIKPGKVYYALADDEISTATSFVKHFGFKHMQDNIYILGC